jgi:hypothetical protein
MALSSIIASDIVIKFIDRGPADGSGTGTPAAVTVKCRNFSVQDMVGKKIQVAGFGTLNKYRPGKLDVEADLELYIDYTGGPVTAVVGHYAQIAYTLAGQTEVVSGELLIISNRVGAQDDEAGIQFIRLEGLADT